MPKLWYVPSSKAKKCLPSPQHKMQSMWPNAPLEKYVQGKFTQTSSPAKTTACSQIKTTIQIALQQRKAQELCVYRMKLMTQNSRKLCSTK